MNHYDPSARAQLLKLARASIRHGLEQGAPLEPDAEGFDAILCAPRACFVTLKINGDLRGCIGSLEAYRPLYLDVAHNAFSAAFRDPRFEPLQADEFKRLELHISVLTPPEPMTVRNQADLLDQLRPGVDGLVIEDGSKRATFLPSVWEQLPDPNEFLLHLKYKAGMSADHWSATLQASRYTAEAFGDTA